jgi:hypothetical protein
LDSFDAFSGDRVRALIADNVCDGGEGQQLAARAGYDPRAA